MKILDLPPIRVGLDMVDSLKIGEIGTIMARAGVGKTALLCMVALEEIGKGGRVLHICIDETPDKIKAWYEELLLTYGREYSRAQIKETASKMEPFRFIASFLHNSFSLPRLRELITNLSEQAGFRPTLMIMDGLDVERFGQDFFHDLKLVIRENNLPLWMSVRAHRHIVEKNEKNIPYPCNRIESFLDIILILEAPDQNAYVLKVLKDRGEYNPEDGWRDFRFPPLK